MSSGIFLCLSSSQKESESMNALLAENSKSRSWETDSRFGVFFLRKDAGILDEGQKYT